MNALPSESRYHLDARFHARVEATRAQLQLDGVTLHAYDRSGVGYLGEGSLSPTAHNSAQGGPDA
jgi:hypothetical protein